MVELFMGMLSGHILRHPARSYTALSIHNRQPFEFEYLRDATNWSGKWVKSKAGLVPGYRSQMALLPDIKLGVFISIFTSDSHNDTTESAFTIPAIQIVGPAIEAVLSSMQVVTNTSGLLSTDLVLILGSCA
jgi:hypothetical protein